MWTSMTLSSDVERAVSFQTSRASVPRDTVWPWWRSRYSSSSNSRTVSSTRAAAARDFSRHEIDLEIADAQAQRLGDPAAPQQRADPRQHLLERERLDQIVVGAAVEAGHAILERVARRQHQHRRLVAALAQRSENLQAVAARQHEIEQDDVERLGVQPEERAFAGVLDRDVVAFAVQPFPQGVGDLLFVLDDEDPRRHVCRGHPDRTAGIDIHRKQASTPIVVLQGAGVHG